MKNLVILCLFLGTSALAQPAAQTPNRDNPTAFWQQFRAAVAKADSEAIASLSKFPIEMPYGFPTIKNKAQLRKRYRQVFNAQTNAAVCFSKAKPETDSANPKHFTVTCPDVGGNEVVMYHFELTRTGWKFTALDNLNE